MGMEAKITTENVVSYKLRESTRCITYKTYYYQIPGADQGCWASSASITIVSFACKESAGAYHQSVVTPTGKVYTACSTVRRCYQHSSTETYLGPSELDRRLDGDGVPC